MPNNTDVTGSDLDAGFENKVTIPAQGTTQLYYYLAINSTLSALQSSLDQARTQMGAYWFDTTSTDWTNWLNSGKRIQTSDSGVNATFDRNLVVMKDSQNPTTGSFPAATNPASYSYKVWARDSAFTAMAMDAAGHYSEAEKYWNWLSSVQNADGTFSTCYSLWTSAPISFVQPEYDPLGTFLAGVWRHIQLTGKSASDPFVQNIWPAVEKSANFITGSMDNTTGLGASDHSIWEQDQEFYTFTQAMNVAGLYAAENIGGIEGAASSADNWNGAVGTILSNIQKDDTAAVPGLWTIAGGYYNQADTTSYTANTTVDSSTNALIGWGAIDAASSRAISHVQKVVNTLTHDTWGIARYPGDVYYYTSPYSPAGDESGSSEPVWPQMTNYVALDEIYTGDLSDAFRHIGDLFVN